MGGNSSKEEGGEGGAGEASEQRGQPGEGGAAPLPRSPGKPRRSQAPQALEFEDEGGEDDGGSERKGSMWKQLSEGYGQLVDAVIRPPRSIYDVRWAHDLPRLNHRPCPHSHLALSKGWGYQLSGATGVPLWHNCVMCVRELPHWAAGLAVASGLSAQNRF